MKPYPKPMWAVMQDYRETGLLEDICKHGVGHPNLQWLRKHDPKNTKRLGIHGCDGCCYGGPVSARRKENER